MIDIKTFKRQHEEIYDIISALKVSIGAVNTLEAEAFEISKKINTLAGKLKVHLGNEDRYMYPYILEKGSAELKSVAQAYVVEMGTISNVFSDYKNRFDTRSKIISDTKEFVKETAKILKVLEDRIKKEDSNLYQKL
jgi:DUF438 domain-containing protein